jgi:hypothetical protein
LVTDFFIQFEAIFNSRKWNIGLIKVVIDPCSRLKDNQFPCHTSYIVVNAGYVVYSCVCSYRLRYLDDVNGVSKQVLSKTEEKLAYVVVVICS